MHTTTQITQEIAELHQIRSAYNYYLGSYDALQDVENTTYIMQNLKTIQLSIRALYTTLEAIRQKNRKEDYTSKKAIQAESNAIFHFNHDKRFRITE
jgi:hypothetical protein